MPAYLPNHSCEQKFALVQANATSFAFASSAEVVSSFPSFPCFLLAPRSRSSTFGPCGCLHKMPRLFPGMQSSAGEASLLGSQASTAIAELNPLNCSFLLHEGEGFRTIKSSLFQLAPLVSTYPAAAAATERDRLSHRSEVFVDVCAYSVAPLSQRGFLSSALPSSLSLPPSELKGCETNELCFCQRRGHEWRLCSPLPDAIRLLLLLLLLFASLAVAVCAALDLLAVGQSVGRSVGPLFSQLQNIRSLTRQL